MSLGQILNEVAGKVGATLTNVNERNLLITEVNKAAREIYRKKDLPVSLKEVYIRVTANNEVALPPFVGELRAIRSGCSDYCTPKWELHTMYPRYNKVDWINKWNNWRIKGTTSIGIEWLNSAPGTIVYPIIDPNLIITIIGETTNSNRAVDTITMTAATMSWTKSFLTINKIIKNKITDYDVILMDADSNECSIIYADQLEARYQLVDVSQYPEECCVCPDGTSVMELLYKPILPIMSLDSDDFPVSGYDDVIVLKTLQLLSEDQEGKEQRALLMDAKASRMMNEISADKEGHISRKINFKRNPFFKITGGYQRW